MVLQEYLRKTFNLRYGSDMVLVDELTNNHVHSCDLTGVTVLQVGKLMFKDKRVRFVQCDKCGKLIYSVEDEVYVNEYK